MKISMSVILTAAFLYPCKGSGVIEVQHYSRIRKLVAVEQRRAVLDEQGVLDVW